MNGFCIIGALVVGNFNVEEHASKAVDAARRLRQLLSHGEKTDKQILIGAVADINSTDIHFFVSQSENGSSLDSVSSVMYENNAEKYIWERGCLIRCELPISVPLYIPLNSPSGEVESVALFSYHNLWMLEGYSAYSFSVLVNVKLCLLQNA